uniref:Arginine vasopressin-induced protein 1 n=1 Tax=Neolamprologus brichardi TaxID=32507 RepID=A0A3Q4I1G7_NEOBR
MLQLVNVNPFTPKILATDVSQNQKSRKAGSANIFSNVNLWQLQRLFRAAGDQDAEQRAQLIWGHGDEAELAKALIGLRARSHHKGLRTNGRDVLGTHWLRAFSHLRCILPPMFQSHECGTLHYIINIMKSRNNTGLTSLYRVNESNVTLIELLHQFILSLVCASISRDK